MTNKRVLLVVGLCVARMSVAHAQLAVIDVASLTQLISQVQTLGQQLATARNQLTQAQNEYQSITGSRGMAQLLNGTQRNYLPTTWAGVQSELAGTGGYPTLGADLQGAQRGAAVLSPQQIATLSPAAGTQVQAGRQPVALLQSFSHEALANSSARFAAVQQLIDTIGHTGDQKAILELDARITAEQGMLQNEHTKLEALYRAAEAQQWASTQTARELTVAGHGQFGNRFQPHP